MVETLVVKPLNIKGLLLWGAEEVGVSRQSETISRYALGDKGVVTQCARNGVRGVLVQVTVTAVTAAAP